MMLAVAATALLGPGVGGALAHFTRREAAQAPYYWVVSIAAALGVGGVLSWATQWWIGLLFAAGLAASLLGPVWATTTLLGAALSVPMPAGALAAVGSMVFLAGLPLGSYAWIARRWRGAVGAWGAGLVAFLALSAFLH